MLVSGAKVVFNIRPHNTLIIWVYSGRLYGQFDEKELGFFRVSFFLPERRLV